MLNPADADFAARLARAVPGLDLMPAEPRYLEEPRGRFRTPAALLARPRRTEEVAALLRACAAARVAVIPFGGGTGLVAGQILPEGPAPLVLSLERMRAVRAVHPAENVLIVEAGATLAEVREAAREAGRLFPLALASQGSARIGGTLATNAGGANVLRYGNARSLCLGIEAVLPDGSVLHGLKRLRKDNSGYDLRDLLIGAEGTLGVITAAALALHPVPAGEGTALLAVPDPASALALLGLMGERAAGCISAFELIARQGLVFLDEVMPAVRQPFAAGPDWLVLAELGLPAGLSPQAALEAVFAEALERGLVTDGLVAQGEAQRAEFWALREALPEANRRIGAIASHDISVPLLALPEFIDRAGAALAAIGRYRVNCFGHVGDGNLHYNVFPMPGRRREEHEAERGAIRLAIHDLVHELGGSVSAEHGIGRLKVADLERYGDPAKLAAMRAIKAALDPAGIMNPGAVLRG